VKKIEIRVLEKREPKAKFKYYFYFGREELLYFSSKRKAKDFSVSLEKTLNHTIRNLIEINKQLYSIHLENYVNMDNLLCVRLEKKFSNFLTSLNNIYKKHGKGNPFSFTAIKYLLNEVYDISMILKDWSEKNNFYNLNHRIDATLKIKNLLESQYYNEINSHKIDFSYSKKPIKLIHKKKVKKLIT
jgi:hypothetical protein